MGLYPHKSCRIKNGEKKYSASAQFLLSASIGVIISRIDRWYLHNLQAGGALLFGAMLAPLLDQSHLVNKSVKLDVCEGFCKAVCNDLCRNSLTKQWNLLEKSGTCTANIGGDVPEVSMLFHQFRYSSPQCLIIVTRSCI